MTSGIYKIINLKTNKFYVGSAVDFVRRKREHWRRLRGGFSHNKYLQASWNKHGEEAFVFVVVEEHPVEGLLEVENKWLQEHTGKLYCYNISIDAVAFGLGKTGELNPSWGKKFSHTPEAKVKIGAAGRGRIQSAETINKRRSTMRGHTVRVETREKIRQANLGAKNPHFGKKRPEFAAKVRKPVVVTTPDGTEVFYDSIQTLRKTLNLTPPSVNRALKSGKPLVKGRLQGYSFRYATPPP